MLSRREKVLFVTLVILALCASYVISLRARGSADLAPLEVFSKEGYAK